MNILKKLLKEMNINFKNNTLFFNLPKEILVTNPNVESNKIHCTCNKGVDFGVLCNKCNNEGYILNTVELCERKSIGELKDISIDKVNDLIVLYIEYDYTLTIYTNIDHSNMTIAKLRIDGKDLDFEIVDFEISNTIVTANLSISENTLLIACPLKLDKGCICNSKYIRTDKTCMICNNDKDFKQKEYTLTEMEIVNYCKSLFNYDKENNTFKGSKIYDRLVQLGPYKTIPQRLRDDFRSDEPKVNFSYFDDNEKKLINFINYVNSYKEGYYTLKIMYRDNANPTYNRERDISHRSTDYKEYHYIHAGKNNDLYNTIKTGIENVLRTIRYNLRMFYIEGYLESIENETFDISFEINSKPCKLKDITLKYSDYLYIINISESEMIKKREIEVENIMKELGVSDEI